MPGPVVHSIIAERLPGLFQRRNFNDVSNFDGNDVSTTLDGHRRELVFGAQGPDYFFFNVNDYLKEGVADKMIKWWNHLGDIQFAFFRLKGPLIELKRDLKRAANQVISNSELIERIATFMVRIRETSLLFSRVMRGYVKKAVFDRTDPFGLYVSPMQTAGLRSSIGSDEWEMNHDDWSWFDILHSRRTGDFVSNLLDIATGKKEGYDGEQRVRPRLWSYAVGYLSHLAADVVGHAYVNTIVGGPYRMQQAQRHTTQEKIMDVWAYNYYFENPNVSLDLRTLHEGSRSGRFDTRRYYEDPVLLNSGMHKNFLFTDGRLEPQQWERDPDRALNRTPQRPIKSALKVPEEISKNFTTATDRAYDPEVFGRLNADGVDVSYRVWYMFFYNATNTLGPVHPSELPNQVTINNTLRQNWTNFRTQHARNLLGQGFEAANDLPGGGGGSRGGCVQGGTPDAIAQSTIDCLEDAAESIMNFFENNGESISQSAEEAGRLAAAVADGIVDSNVPMNGSLVNFSIQKVYEKLWVAYKRLLMLMTSIGFSYMYPDGLLQNQIEHMWNPSEPDHFGNTVGDLIVKPNSPRSGFPRNGMRMATGQIPDILDGLENESHLMVPVSDVETPETVPGPDLYAEHPPHVFIDDPNGLNATALSGSKDPPLLDWIAFPRRNSSDPSRSFPHPSISDSVPELSDFLANSGTTGRYAKPVLGNAVDLTVELYRIYEETGQVPNLNMSGDRAIGFPTWATGSGHGKLDRDRWQMRHGDEIPWIHSVDKHVLVPKLKPEDDVLTGPNNDSYY